MSGTTSSEALVEALAPLAPLPCDAAGPVFAEPWQAQAFAMVLALHRSGHFTWGEWAETLSREIAAHGSGDDGSHYYTFWLGALEEIMLAKGLAEAAAIDDLASAWARAAEATPHGSPIMLTNDPAGAAH
jgi:nitrile hydratase accessory protein